jgi:hypothetical protein
VGIAGSYFARGATRHEYAAYSKAGDDSMANMKRLQRKFATAATPTG